MFVEQYLKRIGIAESKNPSAEFLLELQIKHMLAIPFEDLDIPDRDEIVLDTERIFKKLILNGRGGFCYELNGLFYVLLRELGFDAQMIEGRVYNKERRDLGPPFDHMAILVKLENTYLADVGFGDSFRSPIIFPGGTAEDVSGSYKIENAGDSFFRLMKIEDGEWTLKYEFTDAPRKIEDFREMCVFQQTNPGSVFRSRMVCTIATPGGRITLSDKSLAITNGSSKLKRDLTEPAEFYSLLKEYFGINLEQK